MQQCIYVSSASRLFERAELLALLEQSRANNRRQDITGLLLYKGGNFMQVFEGPDAAVDDLHARIAHDPRHHGVVVLFKGPVPARDFTDWSMGFSHLDHPGVELPAGYSEFLNLPLTAATFGAEPTRAKRLLLLFRQNMR